MSEPGSERPPAEGAGSVREQALEEAASVAKGSGIAMGGALVNRGVRFINTWQLTHALDVGAFGVYTSVTTIVNVLAYLAPLGMNSGVLLFGSRYMASGEKARLKGALLVCLGGTALAGVLVPVIYLAVTLLWPWSAGQAELGRYLPFGALSITSWAILLVAVSALRAARDARAQTSVYNITLPILITVLSVLATGLGFGIEGALLAFGLAHLLTFGEAMVRLWRHFGGLMRDASIRAELELAPILRFSIPEALSSVLLRLTQWMDLLQLTVQSTSDQVGIYKVASALAMVGNVPAAALLTIFQSTAAELLYLERREQLDHVLKIVTRWLVAVGGAVYIGIVLGQDVVYAVFDPAYAAGASSLIALMIGQLVHAAAVPAASLIPMSGMARLNLANGVAATLLNLGLCYVLIPPYGAFGASVATMVTLILWSAWRVAQVWKMLGCFPLTWGVVAILLGAVGGAWVVRAALAPLGVIAHGVAAVLVPSAFLALLWRVGRTPDDDIILRPLSRKLKRVLGRR